MTKSIHRFVVDELQARKGTWPTIARKTGISPRTVQKIADGTIVDPGIKKMEKLAEFFRKQSAA